MKADHRKHLEQNELAGRLASWWKGTGQARSSSTTWGIVGAVILVIVLIIAWRFYSDSAAKAQAAIWPQIEANATSTSDLKSIVESNRGTNAGRIAKVQLARLELNGGLNKVCSSFTRNEGIADVEDARKLYTELITEAKGDAELVREAMLGAAKAEESLVGIPKADAPSESRGSLDKALELYEQTAKDFDKTAQGTEAAARAKDIHENKAKIQQLYESLNAHFAPPDTTQKPSDSSPIGPLTIPPAFGPEPIPNKPAEPTKPLGPPPGEPAPKTQSSPEKPLAPPPEKSNNEKQKDAKPAGSKLAPPPATTEKKDAPAKPDQPKSDKSDKPKGV